MRRYSHIFLLLMASLLVLSSLPATSAQADDQLAWDIPYDYGVNNHYPTPDCLPDHLGLVRTELTADALLQVSLKPHGESCDLTATLTAGDHTVRISGQGDYGPYQQSPLRIGEFICQTEGGVACKLYLQVYPAGNEQQAVIVFAENTPQVATVTFKRASGNIQAISTQVSDRLKSLAKLPIAYLLNGQPLTLLPAPLLQDNQVLVPVRPLLEALGASVAWDGSTQTVQAGKGDTVLTLSLSKQTLQLNGGASQPLVIQRQPDGHTYAPLEPLAAAFGANVLTRRDSTVNLVSRERTLSEQGRLQFILVSTQNIIIQNDTNHPYDLGGWALVCVNMSLDRDPVVEFRFPQEFQLQPGEQVQVSGELTTEPDGRILFDWNQAAGSPPEVRANAQLIISNLAPGRESISLRSEQADLYLGNWRMINAAGKPVFDLPDVWLAQGQSLIINGNPGESTGWQDLRWPNLPDVEAAYLAEQGQRAERAKQSHEKLISTYAALTEALGLTDSGYYFYTMLEADGLLMEGKIAPFEGKRGASLALSLIKRDLMEPQIGDRVPAYYVSPDGQEAYIGAIKQDGSFMAYRLTQVIDSGFYTWTYERVLPE